MWHLVPILQCPVDVVYHSSDRKAMGIGVVLFIMISAAKVGGAALSYTITEESPPNTRLGDLMEDTHLRDNLTASDLSGLEFTILAGRSTRYFVIHREGNQHFLQTSDVMIDRDDLCSGQGICLLNLDVAVYVSKAIEDFRVIKIQIFVLDVNDHRPVFPEPQTTLYISENANPGIHFVLPVATDLDAGEYGTISYQLRSNFSEFELFKTASIHGASELHLVLNERVDREKLSEYHMEVVSRDGGEPPLSDVMAVHVIVRDTNDNYPVFLRSIYNVSLKEDQPLQVPFVQVSARDIDEGPNGEIMYDFAPQTKSEHGRMFGINNSNGDIYLKLSLDFELEQVYHLTVKATDQGPDSVPVHCKVIIHVLDVNDFRPQIILNLLSSHQEYAEVMENRSPGVFVAHVSVEDLDLGRSGQASCSITKGNQYFSLESLSAYPNEYKILTTRTLDREAVEEISVMIECVDQGEDPLSSVRELKVKVLDENDNPPRFEQSLYTANLYENVSFPQPVFQVNAIDADSGENANVTYFLSENESGGLQIDPMSGLVSTQVRLDHEAMQTYDGHVYAVDGGLPPNTATAAFKIFIDDINDESPLFSQVTYNFGTFENQAPGTEVGTVVATDADEPPHDLLLYSIHPQEEEASDTFQINPATGKLTILKMLDRESIAFYRFMVLATNTGEPYLSATATVNVHVADQNDNAPTVVFPSPDNNTVVLSVFAYVGYAVAHVQAYDVDAGRNSRLNFSIAKGGDLDLLGITPDTGEVIVKNVLRYVAPPNITLLISIADMGTPPKFAAAELHILFNHTENYAIENGLDSSDQNVFPRYPGPSIVVSSTLPRETLIVIIVGCLSVVLAIGLIVLLILVCRRAPPERKKQESSEIQYSGIQRFAPEDGGDELSVASGSSSHCNRPVRVSPLAVSITMETMCPAGLSPVGEGQAESSLVSAVIPCFIIIHKCRCSSLPIRLKEVPVIILKTLYFMANIM